MSDQHTATPNCRGDRQLAADHQAHTFLTTGDPSPAADSEIWRGAVGRKRSAVSSRQVDLLPTGDCLQSAGRAAPLCLTPMLIRLPGHSPDARPYIRIL